MAEMQALRPNGSRRSTHSTLRASMVGGVSRLQDAFELLDKSTHASDLCLLDRPSFRMVGARFDISQRLGQGYWEFLRLAEDLFVVVSDTTYRRRATIAVPGEDFIEFHFRLSGHLRLLPNPRNPIEVAGPSLLIWRQAEGHDITEFISEGFRDRTMTIYCRPSTLERYFGDYVNILPAIARPCLGKECARTVFLRSALYPTLRSLVSTLIEPYYHGCLRLARAEATVIHILCEVLGMLNGYHAETTASAKLTDRDVRCLLGARDLVVERHAPPLTISQVAHEVGMSTTKLKCGFKTLFGKTIHEFANELRMEYALVLLRKEDTPIAHVAETLGYEYQNSFTVAFKRHFGLLPKEYRRDPLSHINRSS